MISLKLKTLRNILVSLSLVVLIFGAGFRVGVESIKRQSISLDNTTITGKESGKIHSVDFSIFWDVWNRLSRSYIDKKSLDPKKMIYGAVSGMVASLEDPYTVFLPPEQNKEAKDDLGGKFEGIGAQLGIKDKKIVVIAPLKGAPAERAGLKPEDWIIRVDGRQTSDWTLPQAVSKIRGPKGTEVVLTVAHKEATKSADISVIRDEIKVPSVEWEIKNIRRDASTNTFELVDTESCSSCEKVIYLKLARFGDNTSDEWKKAVDEIEDIIYKGNSNLKGLVFDLRNNPGGYLSGSVFIASEFLKEGPIVIQKSASGREQTFTVDRIGKLKEVKMVVLINQGSASASEIVAGALQERGRAEVVGINSFGKGSIQEAQELSGGAGIHITTAKWLLPSKKWINGDGIKPDYEIENDFEKPDEDKQLEKAIEVLTQ